LFEHIEDGLNLFFGNSYSGIRYVELKHIRLWNVPRLYRRKLDSIADEILYNGSKFLDVSPHTWQVRQMPS